MKPLEHTTKPASTPKTGRFALLCGLLHVRGSGAGGRVLDHRRRPLLLVPFILASLLLAPTAANAVFTRKFERQLTSVSEPGGVATDSTNDLWVGNIKGPPYALDELSSAGTAPPNELIQSFPVATAPGSVAVERATSGNIYIADSTNSGRSVEVYSSAGHLEETWGSFSEPQIAIDNSPHADEIEDPSACETGLLSSGECYVYVLTGNNGSEIGGVEKFNSKGVKVSFECAPAAECEFVKANKITGVPGRPTGGFTPSGTPACGIAVDSKGDIYVCVGSGSSVYEYEPSGKYKQDISLESDEVPRLGGGVPSPEGIAVDPISGHLLVSVNEYRFGREPGAVFEFSLETGKFVSQIPETEARPLHELRGMAVDSLGYLFAVDQEEHAVDVWGPGAYFPAVALGPATGRTGTSAVLAGEVDPAQHGNTEQEPDLKACDFQLIEEAKYTAELAKGEEEGFAGAQSLECEPRAGEIKSEPEEAHPVKAAVHDLKEGVTYRYRLVATSGGSLGGTEKTASRAFTAPAAPRIESTSAGNISSTSADLDAQIDPLGAVTSYRFEYDTRPYTEGEGVHGVSVPVPDASIGAGGLTGSSSEGVVQHLGGLAPGTTYYYRVVAENAQGVAAGGVCEAKHAADCVFTTLPEPVSSGRGYELVTPANRQGGGDMFGLAVDGNGGIPNTDVGEPAESGEGFLLETNASFGEFPFAVQQKYTFTRELGRGGWSATSLASRSLAMQRPESSSLVSPDLSLVAFADGLGSSLGEEGVQVVDLLGPPGARSVCEGEVTLEAAVSADCYIQLHRDARLQGSKEIEEGNKRTVPVGGSRDLSHVVLQSGYTSACHGGEVQHGFVLCEWAGNYEELEDGEVTPELQLVDQKPESESEPRFKCGARLGEASESSGVGTEHGAVSADGSRVFFTAPDPAAENKGTGCWNGAKLEEVEGPKDAPQLYVRVDGRETLEVSRPEPQVSEGAAGHTHAPVRYPAVYVGASEDGSKVFFVTRTWMTENHPEGHDVELYECEIREEPNGEGEPQFGCRLSRVSVPVHEAGTPGAGQPDPAASANVFMAPVVSANGAAVYFAASGALAEGASAYPPITGEGGNPINVYRYDTASGSTSYIARIAEADSEHPAGCQSRVGGGAGPCAVTNWYATPDGRFLLFGSSLPVGGDNTLAGGCAERSLPGTQGVGDGRCLELYRYDAQAAEDGLQAVVCVSCGSSAADAAGSAEFARSGPGAPALGAVRAMSDDGEFVFFDSQGALVPGATNHTLDVYQWHEDLATHVRSVSLVGSGGDSAPTFFLGYSPNPFARTVQAREGGNVFIGTHARLAPQDTDVVGNIYDARVCEPESPCIQPPAGETAQCEGGSCQTPPAAPPDPIATLLAPPAPVNLAAGTTKKVTKKTTPKCKQGYVRKKVKKREACVKAKSKKKARAKKATNDLRAR